MNNKSKKKAPVKQRRKPLTVAESETLLMLVPRYGFGDTVYLLDKRAKLITKGYVIDTTTKHSPEVLPEKSLTVRIEHYYNIETTGGVKSMIHESEIIPTFKEASYQLGCLCIE